MNKEVQIVTSGQLRNFAMFCTSGKSNILHKTIFSAHFLLKKEKGLLCLLPPFNLL